MDKPQHRHAAETYPAAPSSDTDEPEVSEKGKVSEKENARVAQQQV